MKSLGANYGFITSKAIGAHDIYVESRLQVGGQTVIFIPPDLVALSKDPGDSLVHLRISTETVWEQAG